MTLQGIRWRNFRSFEDTGWLDLRPITLFLGANASGKSSLIAPLLLLRQTHEARDPELALKTRGRLANVGNYNDFIFAHERNRLLQLQLSTIRSRRTRETDNNSSFAQTMPAGLALVFKESRESVGPDLEQYIVKNPYGEEILRRERQADGTYSVEGPQVEGDLWTTAIEQTGPDGFLFTPNEVFARAFELATDEQKAAPAIPKRTQDYFTTVGVLAQRIGTALDNTFYIGPLRDRPKRFYELSGERPFSVGPAGQYAPEMYFRAKSSRSVREINNWVERFDFGQKLKCTTAFDDSAFRLLIARGGGRPMVNIADTGFGFSQVFPLIVQGIMADEGATIIAEQPEIHLNPKLQSVLGDLFAALATRKVRTIIETHSEHLVLRLRRLIAERVLKAEDVAMYYTARDGAVSYVRRIPIDAMGHIPADEWPQGFFAETLAESLALATAQAKRVKHAR